MRKRKKDYIRTPYNREIFSKSDEEQINEDYNQKITQPGQTEPLEILYNKFLQGFPISHHPSYQPIPGVPSTFNMDAVDKLQLQQELAKALQKNEAFQKQQTAKEKELKEKEYEELKQMRTLYEEKLNEPEEQI